MSPTLEQIHAMKASIKDADMYEVKIKTNKLGPLRSNQYFFVWDDSNQILYAVSENADLAAPRAPFKMTAYPYSEISGIAAITN